MEEIHLLNDLAVVREYSRVGFLISKCSMTELNTVNDRTLRGVVGLRLKRTSTPQILPNKAVKGDGDPRVFFGLRNLSRFVLKHVPRQNPRLIRATPTAPYR